MDILKINKIKLYIILTFLLVFSIFYKITVVATVNPFIEITNIEADLNNQAMKFTITNKISENIIEYGILLSKTDEEFLLENNNLYKYQIKSKLKENFSVSIKIPEYAFYQNIYAVVYVKTENKVIYSNKVCSSYADVANLDKVIIKDINFNNNSLNFRMASSINNNAEYGLIFSKDKEIIDLTIENAKNAQFETEIIKLTALNQNNEFSITIKNIPLYELNTPFKVCAYVKDNNTLETYYTDTYQINILEIYFDEIINNIDISYNNDVDGIKFKVVSTLINNDNYQLGFVFINKETSNLTIDTKDAYIVETISNEFSVTIKNIPDNEKDEKIYAVAYLKTKDYSNHEIYYYSNIYITSYEEVKDTYLTNN